MPVRVVGGWLSRKHYLHELTISDCSLYKTPFFSSFLTYKLIVCADQRVIGRTCASTTAHRFLFAAREHSKAKPLRRGTRKSKLPPANLRFHVLPP